MEPMKPTQPMEPVKGQEPWWPEGWGEPGTAGSQGDLRYAFSPTANVWPHPERAKSPSMTPATTRSPGCLSLKEMSKVTSPSRPRMALWF